MGNLVPREEGELIKPEEELQVLYEVLRSEVNLLCLPFFALDDKDVRRRKQMEFRAVVERSGRHVEVVWSVSANAKFGYPGPFDRRVHRAVEELLGERPLPLTNPVPLGSLYGLCRRMGLSPSGSNYAKVKLALRRLTAATIESKGSFYLKGRRRWLEDVFHLYDRVVFVGEELPDGTEADQNYLYLSSWYLENFNAGYTRPLDYAYYKSLNNEIARRLYELLGVKFYGLCRHGLTALWYHYETLCRLLPLMPQNELKYARRQLKAAHELLRETGFLEYTWEGWKVCYRPGPRVKAEISRVRELPLDPLLGLESEQQAEAAALLEEILEVTGDGRSRRFYLKVARLAAKEPRLQELIFRCLSEVKEEKREGLIRTTKGAVFVDKLKRYCQERGIDLGLKT